MKITTFKKNLNLGLKKFYEMKKTASRLHKSFDDVYAMEEDKIYQKYGMYASPARFKEIDFAKEINDLNFN